MDRLRVLILATRVPLTSGDGTPSFILDSATALSREFDISILAPRVQGIAPESMHAGVRIRRFAYFPRRWEHLADDAIMPQLTKSPMLWLQALALVLSMTVTAVREHRRDRFDLVHAQWILPSGLVASLLRFAYGIPFLITARGADVFRLDHAAFRWMKRCVINRAARFIGVSRDIATHIDGLSVPVEVQPSGIDFPVWERLVGARRPQRGRILFVGRLATKKGADDLIRAISHINSTHLVIVGDGPLRDRLGRLTEDLNVAHRVEFLGRRTRAEVAEQLRIAACIVIPSVTAKDGDRDGTPNVLGEAAAAGVPAIGSRIAGIAEHIIDGRTGLLFESGDVAGLRARIRDFLQMPDPDALAREARSRLRANLDLECAARRHAAWYRQAAATGQRR